MEVVNNYIDKVADHFQIRLGTSLVEVYKLGSLAHGGFSEAYSDLDVGLILNCEHPPEQMDRVIAEAKGLDPAYGKKLSVFWGNPALTWGRLPVLDRLDLLDHGVPLLNGTRAAFLRPSRADIRRALRESIEKSWRPRITVLCELTKLEPKNWKPYIRCILYPARLIFSWDRLGVDSNDCAVGYLRQVRPPGLDLRPIELALTCRHGQCEAEKVFDLKADLDQQFKKTMSYISET
jgi:hypothetical protein